MRWLRRLDLQRLNLQRLAAVMLKEFIQLRRDRFTFAMMIGIPLIQMTLFGFAINGDPKRLPTVVVPHDNGIFTRSIVRALENSGYFEVTNANVSEAQADRMLAEGSVQFAITIPADFSRQVIRGERPALLLEADATDPSATGNAIAAVQQLAQTALQHDLTGTLANLQIPPAPFELRIQRRYNPEGITQYNVVPGL
ncbi:MAG TPA: ABC transporter permease, partial [Rhodocyclaceae bacterium]|nr:ABC transporter permease [Rhodocyclaceae bacterium]